MAAEQPAEPVEAPEFADRFQFIDHIHGQIQFNQLERDAIDSPEFQRLFRIAQLGLVDITYQTGNHTRGAHSIGTCHTAQVLLAALQQNGQRRPNDERPIVTKSERILIRLGALLHDIPHGPFSHDIEKKKHLIKPFGAPGFKIKSEHGPFEKHDDYVENAAFYIAVFDANQSILARVLAFYSKEVLEKAVPEGTDGERVRLVARRPRELGLLP
jgi:HD superfamily phosphohydrolase